MRKASLSGVDGSRGDDADSQRPIRPKPPLRVGLVVDSLHGPAWVESIVRAVQAGGDARLVSLLGDRCNR